MKPYDEHVSAWTIEDALAAVERAEEAKADAAVAQVAAEDRLLAILGWKFSELPHATLYDHPRLPGASGMSRSMALQRAIDATRMVLRQPKAPPKVELPARDENLISCQEAD